MKRREWRVFVWQRREAGNSLLTWFFRPTAHWDSKIFFLQRVKHPASGSYFLACNFLFVCLFASLFVWCVLFVFVLVFLRYFVLRLFYFPCLFFLVFFLTNFDTWIPVFKFVIFNWTFSSYYTRSTGLSFIYYISSFLKLLKQNQEKNANKYLKTVLTTWTATVNHTYWMKVKTYFPLYRAQAKF